MEAWLAFSAMTVFIFATLESAPIFSTFLWKRALFISTLTWFFGIAAFFFLHYILSVARIRSVIHVAVLCGVAALYVHVLLDTGKIERIHMLEYGILTYLALRALSLSMGSLLIYPVTFVLVFGVSLLDEWYQDILPSRYFAWEDVGVNARSVGLTLLFLVCIHRRNISGFHLPFFGADRRGGGGNA